MSKKLEIANATAIHICNSHEPTLDQKLQKSMSCQRTAENETCSKFEYGNPFPRPDNVRNTDTHEAEENPRQTNQYEPKTRIWDYRF